MRKLYEERGILFAVLWIAAYCMVMAPIRGSFGWDSVWMLLALSAFAAGITAFVKKNRLVWKLGLAGWPKDTKRFLYFLPVWFLATGNLWDGFAPSFRGLPLLIAVLSMILVGYVEEMLFRGFLFRALLNKDRPAVAIIVSSVTFGMGHIVNLLAGQASFETLVQIVFAVSWGFILTMVYYKSGSLLPCIVAHAMIDVFSLLGADNVTVDMICVGATVLGAIGYCLYLSRIKEEAAMRETERIRIYPAGREQMERMIAAERDDDLKKAYREMLDGCLEHPEDRDWYAMWMIEKTDGTHIGDLCFKGPGRNPEIGYGILEQYRGRGYATEAVKLALKWAFSHPEVASVEAETDPDNTASRRVLEKCGFRPNGEIGEEGPRFAVLRGETG